MVENFQDNISYGGSTLAVSGDAVAIGSTNAGAKSVIFNNTGSQGHLAWQPTANRTINLPDLGGTVQLTGQVPGAIYDGANSISTGTIRFTNANGVSFSINGQTISGSVAAQTNQSIGLYAVSNTTGASSSSTVDARSISFQGAGIASVGYTNGSVVISVPSGGGGITNVNLSAGTTSNNLSAFVFSNSNNVSFGLNGSTITATITTPAQTNQSVGLYALGNTTQNSSTTLDARTLSFNGLGAATVGYSNGSIQISVPTQTVQTQSLIQGIYDGANSISTGTIRFINANGVSFSINGQTISGSVAAQTNQSIGLYAVSNTTQNSSTTLDARSISFQGAGVASVGYSNGSVVISVPSGGGGITNVNLSAGTTSNNLSAFVFSNSNNVSFGLNGSTITATVTAPAQTNQSIGLYALGNTTQNSSTTLDARTLSFNGLGAATVGYSNGSIQISVPTQTAQTQSNIAGIYDGANSISTGTIRFTNANGVSFSINGQTISGSVAAQTNQSIGLYALGNTTQNSSTTLDARTLSFNGLGAASVGYSNGSIQISVPGNTLVFSNSNNISFGSAGATTITASYNPVPLYSYEPYPMQNTNTAFLSMATGTSGSASFFPFSIDGAVAAGWVNMVQSASLITGGISSGRQTVSQSYGIYSRGTGANSTTLSVITSGSYSIGVTYNNLSITINQPTTTNSTGYGTGTVSSSGINITGTYDTLALIQYPLNSTMTAGNYWLGIFAAQSTSSNAIGFSQSILGNAMTLTVLAPFGSASSNSGTNAVNGALGANWMFGLGVFSSAGQTNLPGTVAFSAITQNGSIMPYMKFMSTL